MRLTTRTVDTWRTPDGVAIRADVVQDIELNHCSSAYLTGANLPPSLVAGTTTVAACDWPEPPNPEWLTHYVADRHERGTEDRFLTSLGWKPGTPRPKWVRPHPNTQEESDALE